jgi:hypothetical protein
MSAPTIPVRVTLLDTWDEALLELPPHTPVSEVRRAILDAARIRRAPGEYQVKYLGAELNPTSSLADAGIPPNGALIVLSRRRTPVR